jgi:uncharacterized protein YjbI with pentapeptide repeats
VALLGLLAAAIALAVHSRPEPATPLPPVQISIDNPRFTQASRRPAPIHDIVDAEGRLWELSDIPGHALRGLHQRHAQWANADLHGATFIDCDFRGAVLRDANLNRATFLRCHLEDPDLDGTEFGNVNFALCFLRGARMGSSRLPVWAPDRLGRSSLHLFTTGDSVGLAN